MAWGITIQAGGSVERASHHTGVKISLRNKMTKTKTQKARARQNQQPKVQKTAGKKPRRQKANKLNQGQVPMVGAAVAYSGGTKFRKFTKIYTGSNSVRMTGCEYVQAISGASAFTVAASVPMNPGLSASFPRLAQEAALWTRYKVHDLSFKWTTRASTDDKGSQLAIFDYNPANPPPASELAATQFETKAEDVPWRNLDLHVDCRQIHEMREHLFVRTGPIGNKDIKTYDMGNCHVIAVDGSVTNWSKMWIEYDIEFFGANPVIDGNVSPSSTQVSWSTLATQETFVSATPKAVVFDSAGSDPLSIGSGPAGIYTPTAPGVYRISSTCSFRDSSNEAFTCQLEVYKNGAALVPPMKVSSFFNSTGGAGYGPSVHVEGIVACNGTTDTFAVMATLTGAAGTLTAPAALSQLLVSMV